METQIVFELIKEIIEENNYKGMVTFLCDEAGVSRSGYYNHFSPKAVKRREIREEQDLA